MDIIEGIHSAQILQKQDGCNIYVIMRTMCSPCYHYNDSDVTQLHEWPQSHCGDNREGTLFS